MTSDDNESSTNEKILQVVIYTPRTGAGNVNIVKSTAWPRAVVIRIIPSLDREKNTVDERITFQQPSPVVSSAPEPVGAKYTITETFGDVELITMKVPNTELVFKGYVHIKSNNKFYGFDDENSTYEIIGTEAPTINDMDDVELVGIGFITIPLSSTMKINREKKG